MPPKDFFHKEFDCILRYHRCGAGGIDVAAELAGAVDETLTKLWYELPEGARDSFAVAALGGYGRYEMSPYSDVDVMLLFEDEAAKKKYSDTAQKFLHSLWNVGFDVGHSVRTIADCLALYQSDVDVWASILETRYVCGNSAIVDRFADTLQSHIAQKQDMKFIESVISGVDERHAKYEHSVKLLEPNLKNSAGGLRDIHSLLWIYRSVDSKYFSLHPMRTNESACLIMLDQFLQDAVITPEEHAELRASFDFLLRIRHETHFVAGALNDVLEFSRQQSIAEGLRYGDGDSIRAVESCMREYFLHARAVYRLNRRLVNHFRRGSRATFWSRLREQVLDDVYVIRSGQLHLRNAATEFASPVDLLRGFYWTGLHSLEMSTTVRSKFDFLLRDQRFFTLDAAAEASIAREFRRILNMESNVAETLQLMNEYGLFGRLLPEWGNLVAFFQHSMYHYYTTDAHTLIALEHAENLLTSKSLLGDAMRSIRRRDLLYYAILFHDIAKPVDINDHEVRGVDIWKGIQQRWEIDDGENMVSFLIRNHLVMEQIAFRRNTGDARTIEEFASLFVTPEQLTNLFVLTYADLSAVNKSVWSNWKEALLQELYLKTMRKLLKEPETERRAHPPATAQHVAAFANPLYGEVFSSKEIEAHIAAIASLNTVAVLAVHGGSHSAVTVITRDAPSLLSNLCGVLSANDASIIDANIFTRNDGIVIDQFRVVDAATKTALTAEQVAKLENDFRAVLNNQETLNHLFERHHRRWKRRMRPLFHPNIRIDVDFQESGADTIVDVYAPDMTGFLYKVTQTIARQGFRISFAKLATRGDGIVDSFYIADGSGQRIPNRTLVALRERILHTISQLISVQMSEG